MNGNDDLLVDPLDRAIYETVHGYVNPKTGKKGALGLAPVVDMPASTLQNKANPSEQFAHFTVREARKIMLAAGNNAILYQLGVDVGEACYPLPSLEAVGDADVLEALTAWQAEVGETAQKVRDIYSDRRVRMHEVEELRRELIQDFERGLALIDVIKGQAEPET